jgi:DNA polymerase-3 subunit alpha
MSKIFVFDVETTGLIPKNPGTEPMPFITQLAFILYDMNTGNILQEYNNFIRIPSDIEISAKITEITGITRDLLDQKGIPIQQALDDFLHTMRKADLYVAHNIEFDWAIISIEASRLSHTLTKFLHDSSPKKRYCTMQNTKDLCKIERVNSFGVYYKFPSLAELYEYIFKTSTKDLRLHDALEDVRCCLKCFIEITMLN